MKGYAKWIIAIIALVWGFKSCMNCGGNNGKMDLTRTNTLVLQPYDGCNYRSMTVTLYSDGTGHVEGTYPNGESFVNDGSWTLVTGSYHDQEQKTINFEIDRDFYGCIMPNFDFYGGGADCAASIAQKKERTPEGKMRFK